MRSRLPHDARRTMQRVPAVTCAYVQATPTQPNPTQSWAHVHVGDGINQSINPCPCINDDARARERTHAGHTGP
ncbi:hypothetical protein [Oryza sativa Japonica Group]|uniref:Uncharacterized protein n=1 Tax=Oryza sativa subsp. japonica TaxID=39947 RepID=Q5QLR3_ORYSJ|nr:hypothetical protein [Oryza sativa Japonica Group]BAD73682.1 hypothetical protein [Oryza sativa Japonica Group]